jgi:hypothetical protein
VILVLGRGSTKNALSGKLALKEITDMSQDRLQMYDLPLGHHIINHMSLNIFSLLYDKSREKSVSVITCDRTT